MLETINDLRARNRIWMWNSKRFRTAAHGLLVVAVLGAMPLTARAQSSNSQTPLASPPPRPTGVLLPAANRLPDANDQMEMRDQQSKTQNYAKANAARKKQIADDTTKLLKMAADLKDEVDKTSKDALSLTVIRKADEIERLAHSVKEKMKLSVGGS
jgi:hypothetical protein